MAGRHRSGAPNPWPYVPVVWDSAERAVAGELMDSHPGWWVVWGPYWRCWSAYALFTGLPCVLRAPDAGVLAMRMREVETAVRTRGR